MNWYKKSQNKNYQIWFAEIMKDLTNNYSKPLPGHYSYYFPKIEKWIKEQNPSLENLSFDEASKRALAYEHNKASENSPEQIKRNMNSFYSETQNINPDAPDFAVDIRMKGKSIPPNIKRIINKKLYNLGNYHNEIPLKEIFKICLENEVVPIQEDGTYWSGMLMGGAECGSEGAKDQHAKFDLAVTTNNGYVPANNIIWMSWCKMPSGKYEIVTYIS